MRIFFAVPGSLATPTGGFHYLRRIISGLSELGFTAVPIELPGRFPQADAQAIAAASLLSDDANTAPLIIDGLALPAFASRLADLVSCRPVFGLIHHPLANETGYDAAKRAWIRERERQQLACLAGIIVSSPATAAQLVREYGIAAEKITCVTPGTDPVALVPVNRRPPLRLLCVASLTPRKAHRLLLHALAGLPNRLSWRLDLVGSKWLDPIEARHIAVTLRVRRLRHRVWLHGEIPAARLERFWRRAYAHVLPSYFEGYGMAHAEALRRGLPLIIGKAGAAPATIAVRDNFPGAGLSVMPGQLLPLRRGLRLLIENHRRHCQYRAHSRAMATLLPDWSTAAMAFSRFINEKHDFMS